VARPAFATDPRGVIHDLSVVAELKQATFAGGVGVCVAVIHDLSVVAELKRAARSRNHGNCETVIHDLSVVAELKLRACPKRG